MITTTKGEMSESELEKRTGTDASPNADVDWVEYWHEGEMVHRSAHIKLKMINADATAGAF